MSTLSQAVVQFIANLHPLYIGEVHEGVQAARCIEDGTLVFPVEEEVQRAQLLFYAKHFTVKTGLTLHFDEPSELDEVFCKLIEMSKSAGSTALAVLVKSKLGI